MILQLEEGAVQMRRPLKRMAWRFALKVCRSIGLLMNMFRLGAIRSGSMVTRDGSKARTPIRRLNHLKTTHIQNWPSSASSSGLSSMHYSVIDHFFLRCVVISVLCGFISGIS